MNSRFVSLDAQREYVLAPYGKDDLALVEAFWVYRRRDETIEGFESIAITSDFGLNTELDERLSAISRQQGDESQLRLDDIHGVEALRLLLGAGRLMLHNVDGMVLSTGHERLVRFDWQAVQGDEQHYRLKWLSANPAETFQRLLAFASPHYLDLVHGQIGPLTTGLNDDLLAHYHAYDLLNVEQAEALRTAFNEAGGVTPPPLSDASRDRFAMVPRLTLGSHRERVYQPRSGNMVTRHRHRAGLAFDYGGFRVSAESPASLVVRENGQHWRVQRDQKGEQRAIEQLRHWGFKLAKRRSEALSENCGDAYEMTVENGWLIFVRDGLPRLREAGWDIVIQPDFAFDITSIDAWYIDVQRYKMSVDISFGVRAGGRRINLRAVLARAIQRSPQRFSPEHLKSGSKDSAIVLELPAEVEHPAIRLALPFTRLEELLRVFHELRLDPGAYADGEALRWSRLEMHRLSPLAHEDYEWPEDLSLEEIQSYQSESESVANMILPEGLNATLRSYQKEGVMWLKRIQQIGGGGLLADDMGLGKTVQVIAFLLGEYEAGRLHKPALIVVPTSLLANWEDELARFAPALKVLLQHGNVRHQHYDFLESYNVILTSYTVLVRDDAILAQNEFSAVIFDEAQALKNPVSRTAVAAHRLMADMRICLSGTPVENHLGELWSQFDIVMPGLLGRADEFSRRFRQPIETQGDRVRLELLLTRLRPYLLRRTKDEVASDLPEKNEMVVRVELQGEQRDRYESLRREMLDRIESVAGQHGQNAFRMLVLEALLRLRQICCDARLYSEATVLEPALDDDEPTDAIASFDASEPLNDPLIHVSAKLDALLEMLESMLPAGRRILVFSQFTSVLALIQQAFSERGWGYQILTGDTVDRRAPVKAFQEHVSPIMLISLKVGGTGLNLTAADTVILFDPWWNPAVENQAIDRAHRIGQDKNVFVYRLIARGTVEERIRTIQQRKAALSNTLLEGTNGLDWSMDTATLKELFAPLDKAT